MGLAKSMMFWEEQLPDLPPEAYSNDRTREVNDDWLRVADEEEQCAVIVQWFFARFCDPAEETPYVSAEGGYIWIHGGPYDALEQIEERFHGLVPDNVIKQTVDLLQRNGIYEWAPTQLTYYDEIYDVEVDERNEPTKRLEATLTKLKEVLNLRGDNGAREMARNLAYSGVITALETFLWKTMTYWIDHSESTVKNLIIKHPVFRDREVKLGQIYDLHDRLVNEVKARMQNIVWHRSNQVSPMFKYGLGVDLKFRGFDDALRKRHDIVHRSGHDINGNQIAITNDDVVELTERVLEFANQVNEKITAITQTNE